MNKKAKKIGIIVPSTLCALAVIVSGLGVLRSGEVKEHSAYSSYSYPAGWEDARCYIDYNYNKGGVFGADNIDVEVSQYIKSNNEVKPTIMSLVNEDNETIEKSGNNFSYIPKGHFKLSNKLWKGTKSCKTELIEKNTATKVTFKGN